MTYRVDNYYRSVKLDERLYSYIWHGRGNNCNTSLFVNALSGDKPHLIVDPGHKITPANEESFEFLSRAITADGFDIEDVGLIVNTHSHLDHCESNIEIVNKSGAVIALSEEEDEYRNTIGIKLCSMLGVVPPEFTPLFYLKQGQLKFGTTNSIMLQVIFTPGHSPGSICLYWPDKKILITGDLLFNGSIGRTDFPGGSIAVLKSSLDKLTQLDIECIVPGHSTDLGNIIQGKDAVARNFRDINQYFF